MQVEHRWLRRISVDALYVVTGRDMSLLHHARIEPGAPRLTHPFLELRDLHADVEFVTGPSRLRDPEKSRTRAEQVALSNRVL